jgi:hypothetical protein
MDITRTTKLFDLLEAYPFLEEQIIGIAPPFQNLKNPVLRRTVGKLATIEKAAQIGGVDVDCFVNVLRRAAGQPERHTGDAPTPVVVIPRAESDPDWIAGEPEFTLDGNALLESGEVPLLKINELLARRTAGGCILLVTNFEPSPILEAVQKQGRNVFHKVNPANPAQHLTFIM